MSDPAENDRLDTQRAAGEARDGSIPPRHVCGLEGYNGMIDPPCPACVWWRQKCGRCGTARGAHWPSGAWIGCYGCYEWLVAPPAEAVPSQEAPPDDWKMHFERQVELTHAAVQDYTAELTARRTLEADLARVTAERDEALVEFTAVQLELSQLKAAQEAAGPRVTELEAILEAVNMALDGEGVSEFMESFGVVSKAVLLREEAARLKAEAAGTSPSIDCPLCGVTVHQVSSATLSLALWQHVGWVCAKAKPGPSVEELRALQRHALFPWSLSGETVIKSADLDRLLPSRPTPPQEPT